MKDSKMSENVEISSRESSVVPLTSEKEYEKIDIDPENTVDTEGDSHNYFSPSYGFQKCTANITGAFDEFVTNCNDNYTNGCKWAPDGTCLLTSSADNCLRIFNLPLELHCKETWGSETLPEMKSVLKMKEGGLIYDYCWYPPMSSWYPETCCLISTSKDNPIHLWNAYTGNLCGSYIPINHLEEIVPAYSIAFSHSGEKIYCGFCNLIRVFDTSRPGGKSETRVLKVSSSDYRCRQTGIVSCFAVHPLGEQTYAVGNYLKSIGLYAEPDGTHLAQLKGHAGGVTHLRFSPDGTKLFSGGRKDRYIHCWDMRNLGSMLYVLERDVVTNQRISFDITPDGHYLLSGSTSGKVSVWDLTVPPVSWDNKTGSLLKPLTEILGSKDCINGVSIHQQYPILATSSGQWHVKEPNSDSEEETENVDNKTVASERNVVVIDYNEDEMANRMELPLSRNPSKPLLRNKKPELIENSVKLWWIGN